MDPIPVFYRMTINSGTEKFSSGLIGLETAIPLLEEHNVDFTKVITVKQAKFSIEREYVTSGDILTPYILYIGDIMADTVMVADEITTNRGYYGLNEGCKDPYWRVQSQHNVMVEVEMVLYAFQKD